MKYEQKSFTVTTGSNWTALCAKPVGEGECVLGFGHTGECDATCPLCDTPAAVSNMGFVKNGSPVYRCNVCGLTSTMDAWRRSA